MTQAKPHIAPSLTPMDYVRGALLNALHSGLTLDDVCRMSANADNPEAFDRAVNMLASIMPRERNPKTGNVQINLVQAMGIGGLMIHSALSKITPDQRAQIVHNAKGGAPHA